MGKHLGFPFPPKGVTIGKTEANAMKQMLISLLLLSLGTLVSAQTKADELKATEAAFSAMLKNATLKGTWVPVQGGATTAEKADGYHIARAEKIAGHQWRIVSKIKHKGKEIEYPMMVEVRWAGDVAVMSLDDVAAGRGRKYSARVMYHNDRYAGSWWSQTQAGGLLSGAITRPPTK